MITAGIDIGSVAAKAVLFDMDAKQVLASAVLPTGWNHKQAADAALETLLAQGGLAREAVRAIAITGYGRVSMKGTMPTLSEITCHAAGAHFYFPQAMGVIDIGGQDSKAISFTPKGGVSDFVMNDKCAAGTGRFVHMVATLLEKDLDTFAVLAGEGSPITINSMCAVFAESEVVGLLAQGVKPADIASGILNSIAQRTAGMGRRLNLRGACVFSGGLAQNGALAGFLEQHLGTSILVPPTPQLTGALGAALLAV